MWSWSPFKYNSVLACVMSIVGINVIDGNKLVFRDELTYMTPERLEHFVTCHVEVRFKKMQVMYRMEKK